MSDDPYEPPRSELNTNTSTPEGEYRNYAEIPFYRKQWFFWLMYFTISPVAIAILLFGDIYYEKKGKVVSFGLANRIVAGIIAVFILYNISVSIT